MERERVPRAGLQRIVAPRFGARPDRCHWLRRFAVTGGHDTTDASPDVNVGASADPDGASTPNDHRSPDLAAVDPAGAHSDAAAAHAATLGVGWHRDAPAECVTLLAGTVGACRPIGCAVDRYRSGPRWRRRTPGIR